MDALLGVRVGTDVQAISEVAAALERYGSRYTRRLFTEHELLACTGSHATVAPRLAARFAAKEAVIKLLSPTELVPQWRSIEIRTTPGGAPDVHLTGTAAELAKRRGIGTISLSMSHSAGVGMATAVALQSTGRPADTARPQE